MLRTLTPALVSALALLTLSLLPAQDVQAQGTRGVGLFAGVDRAQQVISRQAPSGRRTGLLAGAFVDVETPSWFDVLAEAYLVQRGGELDIDGLKAEAEADYLTMGVYGKVRAAVGPLRLYAYGGPHVDTHLRTRAAGELVDAYREAAGQTFGVTAGAGLETGVGAGRALYLEIRHEEGLTDAFPDPAEQIRHRTVSVLVRLARTPGG